MSDASKMSRSSSRAEKLAKKDAYGETKGLLYEPGIAD